MLEVLVTRPDVLGTGTVDDGVEYDVFVICITHPANRWVLTAIFLIALSRLIVVNRTRAVCTKIVAPPGVLDWTGTDPLGVR